MKKALKNIIYTLLILVFFSCHEEKIIVSGKIENSVNDSLNIYANGLDQKIMIKEGVFNFELDFPEGYYSLRHGNEVMNIYLSVGKIEILFDYENFDESIMFNGDFSNENLFLKEKFLYEEKNSLKSSELFSLDEDEFLNKISEIFDSRNSLIDSYEKRNSALNKDFKQFEKKDLEHRNNYYLLNYESAHSYFKKSKPIIKSNKFNIENNIDYLDNELFINSSYYRSIVIGYFLDMDKINDGEISHFEKLIKSKSEDIKNNISSQAKYFLSAELKNIEGFYEILLSLSSQKKTIEELDEIYNNINNILPGKPSPKFYDYENHAGGTNSLNDFLGKYIYIDVWATWCGPCIREIPSFEAIQQKFKENNIKFLSISIDEKDKKVYNYDKWVQYVKENNLSGVHLFADNAWNSEFIKAYNINSIPRYLLLDIDGTIITSDAPRPSNSELSQKIKSLKHINCNEENCIV